MKVFRLYHKSEMSLLKGGDIFVLAGLISVLLWWLFAIPENQQVVGFLLKRGSYEEISIGVADTAFVMHGALSRVSVEVVEKQIAITASDCAHQLCIKQGFVGVYGVIVCVPNEITLEPLVVGSSEEQVDSYVR